MKGKSSEVGCLERQEIKCDKAETECAANQACWDQIDLIEPNIRSDDCS